MWEELLSLSLLNQPHDRAEALCAPGSCPNFMYPALHCTALQPFLLLRPKHCDTQKHISLFVKDKVGIVSVQLKSSNDSVDVQWLFLVGTSSALAATWFNAVWLSHDQGIQKL